MGYLPTTEQQSELSKSSIHSHDTISQDRAHLNARTTQVAVTAGQLRVVDEIQKMTAEGVGITIRAIAERADLSESGVQKYVSRLRRLGVIGPEGYAVLRAPTGVMLTAQIVGWSL